MLLFVYFIYFIYCDNSFFYQFCTIYFFGDSNRNEHDFDNNAQQNLNSNQTTKNKKTDENADFNSFDYFF